MRICFSFHPARTLVPLTSCTVNSSVSWPCVRQGVCCHIADKWIGVGVAGKRQWPAILVFIDERVSPPASGLDGDRWNDCRRHL